jgi:hypothetical protein
MTKCSIVVSSNFENGVATRFDLELNFSQQSIV